MFDQVERHIPQSHATLPECNNETVAGVVDKGFSVVKAKGSRDFEELAGRIDESARRWPHLRWRIDFNEALSKDETLAFCRGMTDYLRKRIDFLEDPCPWDEEDWDEIRTTTGLELAFDRTTVQQIPDGDVLVIKPARVEVGKLPMGSGRWVITSNMDHPLGQCYAAWWAGRLSSGGQALDTCGLQTHELFEPNEFCERLGQAGPRFISPGGTGLGFDDLLEKLPWKLLI